MPPTLAAPPAPGNTTTDRGGVPAEFQPPAGESYQEANAAIDNIGSDDSDAKPQPEARREPRETRETKETAKPKAEEKPEPKAKESEKPARKSLGDDIDALVKKPEPKAEKAKADDTPVDDKDFDAPAVPKKLREAYRKERETRTAVEKERDDYKGKLTTAEKQAREALEKEYTPRIEAAEKRRAELETEFRFLDYKRSEDYKEKYEGPLKEEWKSIGDSFDGMKVTLASGEETEFDLSHVYQLTRMTTAQARKAASEMFGTAAPEVMSARTRVMRLMDARDKAVEEWSAKGSEREAQREKQHDEAVKYWEGGVKEYQTEYPDEFGHRDGDDEGNGLIDRGMKLAQLAIRGSGIPDGLTSEQRRETVLNAQRDLTLRAMAFPRTLRDLNKARAEIEELRSKLKEFEGSEPTPGNARGEPGTEAGKDELPEAAIDRIRD